MDVRPSFTPFDDDDDHLARRLATAVLLQWGSIPTDVRERITRQAGLIEDRASETVQLREQIDDFIRRHVAPVLS